MSLTVRPADVTADHTILLDILTRHLNRLTDDRRLNWLYLNGSSGPAQACLSFDAARDIVCGAAAAFPRRFHFGTDEVSAWVLGDFCLDPQYRSLGPALQLQRACLNVLDTNEGTFCYDFPSASMVAVYKRLGYDVTGEMLRLAKPLRVDRKVKEMIQSPSVQRLVSSGGNGFLKLARARIKTDDTLEVAIQQGPCGEEFTMLAQEQRGKFGICLQRSAGYLNWRYVWNPLAHHEIVTARRAGRLVGYAVWTQTEEDASIVDLFGEKDPGMVRCLVAEITLMAQKRGVMTLSVSINEGHPWYSLFSEMGFRLRESFPIIVIPSKNFPYKIDPQLSGWYLMQGDRDS